MRVKDIVFRIPSEEIPNKLREKSEMLRALSIELIDKLGKSNESVVYSNLAKRVGHELNLLASFYPKSEQALAMCTRNIFELNLIIRYILRHPAKLMVWLGQVIGDEKDIIEGILKLVHAPAQDTTWLTNRLLELEEIGERHNLSSAKPWTVVNLAKDLELDDEYASLFKLYSKYIHPSSWIVNSPDNEGFLTQADAANIFVIQSQIYAEDSATRIRDWLAENRSRSELK